MGRTARHHRSSRRWGAATTCVATAASLLAFVGVGVGAGSAGASDIATASLDVAHPTAGIHDPAGSLTPLSRDCAAGQVDINTATEGAIGAAVGIKSRPTLERIVAGRPWLRPVDAVSVPGVGPASADRLATALCATPTALPPAVTHAPPTGFSGIDLQTASAQQIASAGLLPLPVAERLKAYGPLPDDLHQVAAPAIPGLSDPTVDKLLSSGKAAITPYPFAYQGTTWRWVSHDGGAVVPAVSDPRFALVVPPGRVTANGAWASVFPKPSGQDVLPSGGFHIYGDWAPEVGVQLPNLDGQSAAGETVLHDAADGPRLSNGTGAADGIVPGSILVAATSLSDFTDLIAQTGCDNAHAAYLSPQAQVWCVNNLRDTPLSTAFSSVLAYQAHFAGTAPGPCPVPSNPLMTVAGSMHSMSCTAVQTSGTAGTVSWRNDSGDALHFGNVYRYQTSPSDLSVSITPNPNEGRFTGPIIDGMADDMNVIPPGDKFEVTVTQGAPPASTQVATAGQAPLFWLATQFTSLLDGVSNLALPEGQMVGCAVALANSTDFQSYLGCAGTAVQNIAKLVSASGKLSAADQAVLDTAAKKAGALGLLVTGVDLGLSGLQWGSETSWDKATYEFKVPPPVIGSGDGTSPGAGSPVGDGKYIARVGTAAYLVTPAAGSRPPIAESITTSADFNCYATGYFVVDNASTFFANDGSERLDLRGLPLVDHGSGAPHCASMSPTWDYTAVAAGGNVPSGIIVKMPDWQGTGSWWITPDGAIETILNGGTYQCLAAKAPVIFNFPFDKIQAWATVGSTPATCP